MKDSGIPEHKKILIRALWKYRRDFMTREHLRKVINDCKARQIKES